MSWLPSILTKTLKLGLGNLKSDEITSQKWHSWMWGVCSSTWGTRNIHVFHVYHQKSHSRGTVYDWMMLMINNDWGGSQSSKPKMKDFISDYQPPNPSAPTKLTETLWKHIEFNYFG